MGRSIRLAAALVVAAGVILPAAPAVAADAACAVGTVTLAPDAPAALGVLQADLSWTRSTGAGILVAVVDSGIDRSNPHLAAAVTGGIDLVGDGTDPSGFTDLDGHGTAIAGEIAARPVEGSGVVGLAPGASLLSVRVFRGTDDESVRNGWGPSTDRLAAGIRYAVDAGARVINVSISNYEQSAALQDAVAYAAASGSLVVASAGNAATTDDTSSTPRYPAAYPGALAVTAVNADGAGTDDSIHGPHVEVAAPGSQVLTTATGAGDCLYAADTPSSSFATGYVSGAAALVVQAHPAETPAQWEYRLTATAVRADPDSRDDVVGWGIVQPFEAITLLPDASTRGPESPFADTAQSPVRPEPIAVEPDFSPSAFSVTTDAVVLVTIVALTVLGTIAVIIVMRTRRRESAPVAGPRPGRGGLLDRTPEA
ncbi:MAG: peptidase [Rhodoglobus sp.]|nr:peptidase [Rhodoglobus sp.]